MNQHVKEGSFTLRCNPTTLHNPNPNPFFRPCILYTTCNMIACSEPYRSLNLSRWICCTVRDESISTYPRVELISMLRGIPLPFKGRVQREYSCASEVQLPTDIQVPEKPGKKKVSKPGKQILTLTQTRGGVPGGLYNSRYSLCLDEVLACVPRPSTCHRGLVGGSRCMG